MDKTVSATVEIYSPVTQDTCTLAYGHEDPVESMVLQACEKLNVDNDPFMALYLPEKGQWLENSMDMSSYHVDGHVSGWRSVWFTYDSMRGTCHSVM